MQKFVEAIARELEKPRSLLKQVMDYVSSRHEVSRDELGAFLENEVDVLEDFEVDLLFSPQFTPTLVDQAAFSSLLDEERLPAVEWDALVNALAARPTVARLVTEDGAEHAVSLTDVSIERFVSRLNLDAEIPGPLAKLLASMPPAEDRDLLKAIARRPFFRTESHCEILFEFLVKTTGDDSYSLEDALSLLELVETYRPADVADLVGRVPHWLEVLESEVTAASQPKPFFADRVQDMHGGGRDQRRADGSLIDRKQRNMAFLKRLEATLQPVAG